MGTGGDRTRAAIWQYIGVTVKARDWLDALLYSSCDVMYTDVHHVNMSATGFAVGNSLG